MFSFKEAFSKLDTLCKLVIPGKIHEVEVSAPVGVAHTAGGETVQGSGGPCGPGSLSSKGKWAWPC
jgi:hypothetical protein